MFDVFDQVNLEKRGNMLLEPNLVIKRTRFIRENDWRMHNWNIVILLQEGIKMGQIFIACSEEKDFNPIAP